MTGVLAAGCGGSSHHATSTSGTRTYPAVNQQAFMASCVRQASDSGAGARSAAYCGVTLRCIEQRLSLPQFLEVNRNLIEGRSNPKMQVVLACSRAGVKKVLSKPPSKQPSL